VQNRSAFYWSEARVLDELQRIMRQSFRDVLECSLHYQVTMRVAAYIVAIQRVTATAEARGLYA